MILMLVVAVAVIGFLATFVWERVRLRHRRELAERAILDPSVRSGGSDGMNNPVAAEVVLREGWRPHDPSGGPFS